MSIEIVWTRGEYDEYLIYTSVSTVEASGGGVRGRPTLGWMDDVKVALGSKGMTVKAVAMRER